jgi:hypothetical protein
MNISTIEKETTLIENVRLTEDTLTVDLSDGRTISAPLAWFPRLMNATLMERKQWRLIGRGYGIHWEGIDEDISIENLVEGKPSGESQTSFKKWLENRNTRPTRACTRRRHAHFARRRG